MKTKIKKPLSKLIALTATLAGSHLAHAAEKDAAQRLVTLTGSIEPKFSIEVSQEEKDRIASELAGLANLPPVEIDVNDLFLPGDEDAIKMGLSEIAGKILEASEILVDLKLLIYRYDAVAQTLPTQQMKRDLRDRYQEKFAEQYVRLQHAFLDVGEPLIRAIESCKSDMCANQIVIAKIDLINFGAILSAGHKKLPTIENQLLRAAIEDSYAQLGDAEPVVRSMFATFVGLARSDGEETKVKLLPRGKHLPFEVERLPKKEYKRNLAYLQNLLRANLQSLINGTHYTRPGKPKTRREIRLQNLAAGAQYAWTYTCYGVQWHAVIYGKQEYECTTGSGKPVFMSGTTVGLGAVLAPSAFIMQVLSPTPVPADSTYVGLEGIAIFAGGPQAAILVGNHGGAAILLGVGGFGGVFAGIDILRPDPGSTKRVF